MTNKASWRLTNPRDMIEHNTTHCYESLLPSMEAMLPAALTSHSRPSTDHPPVALKQTPATGHSCQAQAPCKEQLRLPNTNPRLAASCCQPPAKPQPFMDRSLTTCHRCQATSLRSSSDFTLQDSRPRINQAPRSKAQPPKETSKPRRKFKM